ncbi:MAG: Wadjet anti-phage system protein JetD domain-containing protein, partial [Chromatiaceae bacterium]
GQIRRALGREGLRMGRHFEWLAGCLDSEFQRLISVLIWLTEHPNSGLYLRQLPIPGIDTKWIEANGGRVTDLLRQLHGGLGDLYALGGLRRVPDLLRLRILDPQMSRHFGGLSDLSSPLEEIAALPIAPASALIVENLQTGLALPELPRTVAFLARGYAVESFGAIPWLASCATYYWGDLDTHGFAILSRLRRYLPRARSLMMDQDTLLAYRSLWQREEKPAPAPLGTLTEEEEEVFRGLLGDRWGEHVRLEQERIDWEYASRRIADALGRDWT